MAERGEKVEILKRRTDWFKVRTARGKEGWVDRVQMEKTLIEAGVKKSFRDLLFEDKRHRFEVGFAVGSFDDETITKVRAGLRVGQHFMVELSIGQVSGDFSSSRLIDVNLLADPFSDWKAAPFFTIGVGEFKNTPRRTLVNAVETRDTAANAGLGVRVTLTRKLLFRADWRRYVVFVDDDRNENFRELSAGVSFFF